MKIELDKTSMKDSGGRFITQGLFLEMGYKDLAQFTLKEDHYEYNGKMYYSLKKLFMEYEDPLEYGFATTYLLGMKHWKRLCNNNMLREHIDEWRDELELKIRSQALRDLYNMSAEGSYQASKLLLDRGWDKRGAGRPSKEETEKRAAMDKRLKDEWDSDIDRMSSIQ